MAYSVSQVAFFYKKAHFCAGLCCQVKDDVQILRKQVEADLLKLPIISYPTFRY